MFKINLITKLCIISEYSLIFRNSIGRGCRPSSVVSKGYAHNKSAKICRFLPPKENYEHIKKVLLRILLKRKVHRFAPISQRAESS